MRLTPRPGIVPVQICGVRLLIPTRAASEACPHVYRLNLITSIIWNAFEKDLPEDGAKNAIRILTKKPEQEVDALWERVVSGFLVNGFLIRAEDDGA